MTRKMYVPLCIYMNGRLVGKLTRQSSGAIDFQYDASWLSWEHTMPISLSLPLRAVRFIGESVVAVFDNLLPDNNDIRRRLAARTAADGYDAYNLLAAMGRDCVGALQFLPEGVDPGEGGGISGRPVDDREIAALLQNLGTNPLGVSGDDEFRISVAGAQEKTALLYWEGQWHVPHGATATTHIFKPEIGKISSGIDLSDSVENEYFCMQLMQALGFPTAKTQMLTFEDKRVLVVERFDRRWTKDNRLLRLPQEDLCQALSVIPSRKYEPDGGPGIAQILRFLSASDTPETDIKQFFKAQIVFWLMGATDGHAKNFSIFILPGGRFHLTPIYDVMSAQSYVDAGQLSKNKMKLAMAVGDNRHYQIESIMPRHFMQTAIKCGMSVDAIESIFQELEAQMPLALDSVCKGVSTKLSQSIATGIMKRLRLLRF